MDNRANNEFETCYYDSIKEILSGVSNSDLLSEEEYFALPTNRHVEFSQGRLNWPPPVTMTHQSCVAHLCILLNSFVEGNKLGMVLIGAFPVRLWVGEYRSPDIIFLLSEHRYRRHEHYWETPDLVIEIVSASNRSHDLETKRIEYAQAGIPEYWIVDPEERTISVLILHGEKYAVHGMFGEGQTATSVLLPGFEVNVSEVWAAAEL